MDATIRPAWPDDLEAIGEIYAHYVRNSTATFEQRVPDRRAWSERYWAVAGAGLPFLVAEREGRVGAYAYCVPWKPRHAYRHTAEDSIYVASWAVGTGLGTALLPALVEQSAVAGVRQLIAVITDDGDAAANPSVALHRRQGFVEAGRLCRVGHKHGRWLDTILMQHSPVPGRRAVGAAEAAAG